MKAWLGLISLGVTLLGVGFFAGERYGEYKVNKEIEESKMDERVEEASAPEVKPEDLGYISDSDEMDTHARDMDEYLAKFEHPEEDDDEEAKEDKKAAVDAQIEIFFDEDRWDMETEYDCHELYYYVEDEVLCDEDEHRIEDPEEMIGSETLKTMIDGGFSVIFARNEWSEDLYKITRIDNAYGRVVLGLDEDYEFYKED